MSYGLTTYDFVQQVYYAQEKTILDFWQGDDKFQEVLFEANLLLQELQNAEDWTWLRDKAILGPCFQGVGQIPEFELPDWVYKPSTLNHDCIYLHPRLPWCDELDLMHYITVPLASSGDTQWRKERQVCTHGVIHTPDFKLRAARIGDTITFNRLLTPQESCLFAVMDVQRRIELFHICNDSCTYQEVNGHEVCTKELDEEGKEIRHLVEIPDPNYLVMATAARHAEGSPPALARVAGLQDAAQKIMSAMRQNDASATDADYQDWDIPGYIEVI